MKPVYFERAIFLGWYCSKRDCSFCYMSTIKHREKIVQKFARRNTESILAEVILCRILGWNLGFISGGHNLYKTEDFKELLNKINIVSKGSIGLDGQAMLWIFELIVSIDPTTPLI